MTPRTRIVSYYDKRSLAWNDDDEEDDDREIGVDSQLTAVKSTPQPPTKLSEQASSSTEDQNPRAQEESKYAAIIKPDIRGQLGPSYSDNSSYRYQKGGFPRGDRPDRHENGDFRHEKRPFKERQERPPREEIDPNSNFRQFYEKDPNFYRIVIQTEEPAPPTFEFKLQIFKDTEYQPREGEPILVFASPDYNMVVQDILMDLGAENFRFQSFRHYETPDKHRVFFSVKDREQALTIYDKF